MEVRDQCHTPGTLLPGKYPPLGRPVWTHGHGHGHCGEGENIPVVLYGCVTWSLILRYKHRLGVFENKVQWRIFELRGRK